MIVKNEGVLPIFHQWEDKMGILCLMGNINHGLYSGCGFHPLSEKMLLNDRMLKFWVKIILT